VHGVVKSAGAESVTVGDAVTFTVVVSNTGGVGIKRTDLTLTDDLCTLTFASGDTDSDNVLDGGESWTYTCSGTTATVGTLTNHVTVSGTDQDGNAVTASAEASVTVLAVGAAETARGPLARTGPSGVGSSLNTALALIAVGGLALGLGRQVRPRRHPRHAVGRRSRYKHRR
jgi:uncharacterized repeat protein (TIGR01451 family)